MGNHFAAIGFPVEAYEEFEDLAMRALDRGERFETERGTYARWSPGAGVELWAQDYDDGDFGCVPHFAGEASLRAGLTRRAERPGSPPLDGAFYGWADPGEEDPSGGLFPFVFDVPDYRPHEGLELPAVVDVRVSAFANDLRAYPDEETFHARVAAWDVGFFIPAGTFLPGGEAVEPPRSLAIFGGRVLDCAPRTNPATGARFSWARIENCGGEIEVVADPEDVEGEIARGGVVEGRLWLSGRLREKGEVR